MPTADGGHTCGVDRRDPANTPWRRNPPHYRHAARAVMVVAMAALLASCGSTSPERATSTLDPESLIAGAPTTPVALRYEILDEISHDESSFTQGLTFSADGRLFESSGGYATSSVREVDPETGEVLRSKALDPSWFAEGLATVETAEGEELRLITWREGVMVTLDPDDFSERQRTTYPGEGWGLCQLDSTTMVMSDGTSTLTMRDVATFAPIRRVTATREGRSVNRLNELECVDGLVWANVFQTDEIVVINPRDGRVVAVLDASGLVDASRTETSNVLNGMTRVPGTTDEFLITGKRWPVTYRVRITPE